jgi:hypothetical protein
MIGSTRSNRVPFPHGTSRLYFRLRYPGTSDVQGLAWPESPGLGLALEGLGFSNLQARPYTRAWAWLGPGLAQARALDLDYLIYILCDLDPTSKKSSQFP